MTCTSCSSSLDGGGQDAVKCDNADWTRAPAARPGASAGAAAARRLSEMFSQRKFFQHRILGLVWKFN